MRTGSSLRTARIDFPSGREVLAAYWGFLSSGGLVVVDADLDEGDPVLLEVRIASLRKRFRIAGKVRRKLAGRVVVAFEAGQLQDVLFNAAWADCNGVPERRHRRWEANLPVRFRSEGAEGEGLIVNVSRAGCCLEAGTNLRFGSRVHLIGPDFETECRVRWSHPSRRLLGLEFTAFQDDLLARLNRG